MAYIADILMIHEMTKPLGKGERPSVVPLLEYLKGGGHPTEDVRLFLIALLGPGGLNGRRLELKQSRRRPTSKEAVDFHVSMFHEIQELTGRLITSDWCDEIIKTLPGYRYQRSIAKGWTVFNFDQVTDDDIHVRRRVRRRRQHRPEMGTFDWMSEVHDDCRREKRKAVPASLHLVVGKTLSQTDAIKIAAIQFNKAGATVRKAYKAVLRARKDR